MKELEEWKNLSDELMMRLGQVEEELAASQQLVKELEAIVVGCNKQRDKTEAELTALKQLFTDAAFNQQSQGEPVAIVNLESGSRFTNCIKWLTDDLLINGTKLYTTPTIPEGWQLVPIEPTSEMILAAVKGQSNRTTVPRDDELAAGMYYDMLAAAPKLGDKE